MFVQRCLRRKYSTKLRKKFSDSTILRRAAVYNIITGCVLKENKSPKRRVLTEGKLDEDSTRLEARPKKSLSVLALKCGVGIVQCRLVPSF
jgi:hypothetical protein